MKQEYLISDEAEKRLIEEHQFEQKSDILETLKLKSKTEKIQDTDAWIICFSTESNSESAARELSTVDEWIRNNSSAKVLTNGCSAYFNRFLFPLINDFERDLRKLLYITSAIHKNETATQNINALEEKDLGTIFGILFADAELTKQIKKVLGDRNQILTRADITRIIETCEESTVWNSLFGEASVPTLRKRFLEVRESRNHVMHAHNIDYKTFVKIRTLYAKINSEIQEAISTFTGKKNSISPYFNESLHEAIESYSNAIESSTSKYTQLKETISKIVRDSLYSEEIKEISEFIRNRTMHYGNQISDSDEKNADNRKDDDLTDMNDNNDKTTN